MTDDEFDACMMKVAAAVGTGKTMVADQVEIWKNVFGKLPVEVFMRGISDSFRDYKFAGFPPIGFVAERCGAGASGLSDDQVAILAWDMVLKAMRTHGAYVSVQWPDPVIKAAIDTTAESWVAMCDMTTADLTRFVKPKFIEAYKAHKAAGTKGDGVSTGIIAADAGRFSLAAPAPVAIGAEFPRRISAEPLKGLPENPVKRLGVIDGFAKRLAVPADDGPLEVEKQRREEPPELTPEQAAETRQLVEEQRKMLAMKFGSPAN